jgi:hypothetical protein
MFRLADSEMCRRRTDCNYCAILTEVTCAAGSSPCRRGVPSSVHVIALSAFCGWSDLRDVTSPVVASVKEDNGSRNCDETTRIVAEVANTVIFTESQECESPLRRAFHKDCCHSLSIEINAAHASHFLDALSDVRSSH